MGRFGNRIVCIAPPCVWKEARAWALLSSSTDNIREDRFVVLHCIHHSFPTLGSDLRHRELPGTTQMMGGGSRSLREAGSPSLSGGMQQQHCKHGKPVQLASLNNTTFVHPLWNFGQEGKHWKGSVFFFFNGVKVMSVVLNKRLLAGWCHKGKEEKGKQYLN